VVLAQIENCKYKFFFFFLLGENDKKVHNISDESKFMMPIKMKWMNPKCNIKRFWWLSNGWCGLCGC